MAYQYILINHLTQRLMVRNSREYIFITFTIYLISILSSCSLTKGLKDEDLVYMGAELKIMDKENAKSVENFYEINTAVPTSSTQPGIGNIYVGLYNLFDSAKETGFKNWVKNKLGKKPVIYEKEILNTTKGRLKYYLNGKGFFAHKLECDTTSSDRKVNMTCTIALNERYKVDSIVFPIDSTYAALKLDEKLKRVIISEGTYYDRVRLDYERSRIAQLAGDLGFAEFGVDNVFYYVDTARNNNTVTIYTKILNPTDSTYHVRYTLDSIRIFPNYTLNDALISDLERVQVTSSIHVYESNHYLNHDLLSRMILEKTNEFYNRTNERKTINRLQDLGLFRFINIENKPSPSGKAGHIVQNIYLTPERMQSVSTEVELNNRSGNFLGTGASLRYTHKNLFGHAELFNAAISGQIETQIGDGDYIVNSSDITGSADIILPRLIVPIIKIGEGKNYIPKTLLKSSYTFQRRAQYYSLNSLTFKFGYNWRETSKKFHELYPIVINQVNVTNKTIAFQNLLDADQRLKNSFDNALIAGLQYNYTFSDQTGSADRSHLYFKNEFESSGNALNLAIGGNKSDPNKIANIAYAQYLKNTIDIRKYIPFQNSDLVARILIGSAFAYGNSKELPYIKQYVIGGSNSLRAFRLRGLGPGSFVPENSNLINAFTSQFVDQTGDLKLEMNVEYRFPLFRFLKGATFIDAGNVWLVNDEERVEGNFKASTFYKEIGVGTGLGFRLDFTFFLIRMDIAFPIRAPKIDEGFNWVISDVNPFDSGWRGEYLRYNLGIGYPF